VPPRDLILDRAEVSAKAQKTTCLLEVLARRDGALNPEALRAFITDTFLRVQRCWAARDYGPLRELLGPRLLAKHEGLLRQMRQGHEVHRIEGLRVEALDFVHLYCPEDPDGRQVAALITFEAAAYLVDDRDGRYTRGRRTPALFQEFWVFRRHGEGWRLDAIERTHESSRLRGANYVAGLSA
jgi:predicted lipid-binding transport protein (Tim44 family)